MWLAAVRWRPHELQMWDLTVSPFSLGEQAEESRAGEAAGGPGPVGSLCPLPKGDIGRVPVWSTVETLAKCYYPELAHLREGSGLLADYPFPKGACPGESPPSSSPPTNTHLCHSWFSSVFLVCSLPIELCFWSVKLFLWLISKRYISSWICRSSRLC